MKTNTRQIIDSYRVPSEYPAVTMLIDINEFETVVDRAKLATRFRSLIEDVKYRLAQEEIDETTRAAIISNAMESGDCLARNSLPQSLAIFVDSTGWSSAELDIAVESRVVVDETFATRDLVRSHQQHLEYDVVALGSHSVLYHGDATTLQQQGGWTLPDMSDIDHDLDKVGLRRLDFRMMTTAIDALLDDVTRTHDWPIIVVGSARRSQYFNEHSRWAKQVHATLTLSGDSLYDESALHERLQPVIKEIQAIGRAAAIEAVNDARGSDRFVTGLESCWIAAVEGAVDTLVVERSYHQPARLYEGVLQLQLIDDAQEAGAVDDLVDELIEAVITHGGRVAIIDEPNECGPVCARLRRPSSSLAIPLM